jgi:hypothetical protein
VLTAVLAAVAHVVFLLAPAACSCASEASVGASFATKASSAQACCCKPGDGPMPCRSEAAGQDAPLPEHDSPSQGCASTQPSCAAEPPASLAATNATADAQARAIAPAVTLSALIAQAPALWVPESPALRERGVRPSRAAPIGLVIARQSVLLI